MALINFKDLDLKVKNNTKTITINDVDIEVKQYASIQDKYDIVMVALQKSDEKGIFNIIKMSMYFDLNVIYTYTNLEFDVEDRINEVGLYDILQTNGVIDAVIAAIPEEEYNGLYNFIDELYQLIMKYRNTAGAVLQSFVRDLPTQAAAAKDIVDKFDPKKFTELIQFVQAANGGRPIPQETT